MPVLAVGIAWLAGIFLGSLLLGLGDTILPAALGAALSAALAIVWWPRRRLRIAALCLAALLAGLLRYQTGLPVTGPDAISQLASQPSVALRGVVDAEPVTRDQWLELTLAAQEARTKDGAWASASGRVQVRASRWTAVRYGDRLEVEGKLALPREGEGFSYREYLLRQGVLAIMYRPKLTVLPAGAGEGPGTALMRGVLGLKARLSAGLSASLPEPEDSLAQGILLGNRASMPQGLLDAFARTNTTHIIAISGFNISLVAGALLFIFRYLFGARRAWLLAIAGVAGYTVLVGAAPSVVRAAIMGSILILGTHYGRQGDTPVALVWAAGLMTAFQPLLLWDVGFQLSFLATAGLATLLPLLQSWLARLPRWAGDDLATTLAAQIAVLPVLAVNFGQLSPVTLLANVLVLPVFPPIMVLGGATALLGAIWPPLGAVAGWPAWLFLTYMIRVVEACASLPFASLSLGAIAPGLAWVYYAGLVALLVWKPFPNPASRSPGTKGALIPSPMQWLRRRWALSTLGIVAALAWAGALVGAPPSELRATFLDVGQGDAALIRTPAGRVILVDGGPSPAALTSALGRRLPFWRRDIDLVVLTHPHEDHLAGLVEVLDRYTVRQVLDAVVDRPTATHQRFRETIKQKGVGYAEAAAGQRVELGGTAALEVLHPEAGRCSGVHNCSVVLRLSDGETSLLITGDVDPAAQQAMAGAGLSLRAQVLKVPHHAAAGSLDPAFLAQVQPEVAVVSVGRDNPFGHPAPGTLDMLAPARVYRTDLDGSVEVVLTGGGYRVETGR